MHTFREFFFFVAVAGANSCTWADSRLIYCYEIGQVVVFALQDTKLISDIGVSEFNAAAKSPGICQ